MAEVFNVMKAGDKYVSKIDGKEKSSWNPIGKLIRKDDGKLSLFLNITGEWYGVFPDTREDAGGTASHAAAHADAAPAPTAGKRSW